MTAYDLDRFVSAQNPLYDSVRDELRAGEKRGDWMDFVFPQLRELGGHGHSDKYGIVSRLEAESFARHEVLGPRLRECTRLVIGVRKRSADQIFDYPAWLSFRSCMTLFEVVATDSGYYRDAIFKYFGSVGDARTLEILNREGVANRISGGGR